MNRPKTLLIVGSVRLPRIDAGASRILELCQGFKAHFDKIIIAAKSDDEPHKIYSYDEKISFLPYHKNNASSFWDRINITFFIHKFFIKDLMSCLEENNVTHILIYSALPILAVKKIKRIARKNNTKLIYDVVEFQTLSKQTFASFLSFYLPNIYLNKKGIKKSDKVISISSYLKKYFDSRGCYSVRIPFVFDTRNVEFYKEKSEDKNTLNLLYAGHPKKGKDILYKCIEGLALLPDDVKNRINFNITGTSAENLLKNGKLSKDVYNKTKEMVHYLGKQTNEKIKELYSQSDFSVLIRDKNNRLSQAGFPTKVSESLAHGVPMICNITSDLGEYLINDFNAIILNEETSEEFARAVLCCLNKSRDELSQMRLNARHTAETHLDVSLYTKEISSLFK